MIEPFLSAQLGSLHRHVYNCLAIQQRKQLIAVSFKAKGRS